MKPGYKQTEVGCIPENWEVKRLGEIGSLSKGKGLLKEDIKTNGAVPAIPYTTLYTDFSEVLDYGLIKWFVDDTTQTIVLSEPCVLIASSSNMAENTGKASALIGNTPVAIGREVIVFRTTSSVSYVSYLLSTSFYRKRTLVLARGTTIKHLYPATFVDYKICLPSTSEQRAIAAALSDVDTLLTKLDQLITKKHNLKQATMQQLLTGKKRLPGFSGEWEVKRLGDIAHIKTGSRNNENKVEDGQYPFFVRSEVVERINSYSHDCEAILVPGEGRIGDIFHYINGRFDVHQRVYAITQLKSDISARFIHFYLSSNFGSWAMQNTVKATVDSLRLPTFLTFEMRLPPTLLEQTAISAVLSDMDAEIAALEQRREKIQLLKQGMMQELLTGRTRLI